MVRARGHQPGAEFVWGVQRTAQDAEEREQGILHGGEHAVSQPLEEVQKLHLIRSVLPGLHPVSNGVGPVLFTRHVPCATGWRDRLHDMAQCPVLRAAIGLVRQDVHDGCELQGADDQGGGEEGVIEGAIAQVVANMILCLEREEGKVGWSVRVRACYNTFEE